MLVSQLITRFSHPRVRGALNQNVTGLTHNPRAAGPGIVFVALPENQRSNPYQIITAVERGAAAVICPPGVPLPERGTCITVNDTTEAFALAAAELCEHPSESLKVIGVRGPRAANIAALLQQLLTLTGQKAGLLTSHGCLIGDRRLPIPVAQLEPMAVQEAFQGLVRAENKACVIEVSSHTDHARNLCGIKLTATLGVEGETGGRGTSLVSGNYLATDLVLSPAAIHFNIAYNRSRVVVRAPLVGRSNAEDLMHALRGALNLGIDPLALTKASSRLKPIQGSLAQVRCGQPFSVYIDGANDADSLELALTNTCEITTGRVISVLGGSADHTICGREALGQTAAQWANDVVVTSDNPRELDESSLARDVLQGMRQIPGAKSRVELNRSLAIRRALRLAGPGDAVLVTGKGHRTIQQLERCVVPFDDAVVAQEHLAEIGYVGAEL
jgi:UDP-N-acetylmuramoyl-L-alanyl-D-glutamate--2,6-diaminopimelate ligase